MSALGATLRAGLIGLGAMGRNHARVLNSLDGVELVGVARPGRRPAPVAPFGVPVVADVEQLLALQLDYAVVACPTALHEEVGLRLAEAGVHALIEKPLAPSVEAARRAGRGVRGQAGLVGAVGHIERYNPALQSLRSRLEAGELGDMYQVVTRRQGPFPRRIADVGVVMDLATHDIDLTAWVTGQEYADGLGPHGLAQRPPARGHGLRGRRAGRRPDGQPPGELAQPVQGAVHRDHR